MGSEGETKMRKAHYNMSMSRRTRKPQNLKIEPHESFEEKDDQSIISRSENQKSLKQLIEGRCSLAQHFFREEEKQQSVVVRPPEDGSEGAKLKRIVRNYAKVLSHLIKVKQESYIRSWRKPAQSLKLIKHK